MRQQTGSHWRRREEDRFGRRRPGSDRSLHLCADRRPRCIARPARRYRISLSRLPHRRRGRHAPRPGARARSGVLGRQPALPRGRVRRGDPDVLCRAPPRVPLPGHRLARCAGALGRIRRRGVDRAGGRSVLADRAGHGCRDRHVRRPDARRSHQRDPAGPAAGGALRQRLPRWRAPERPGASPVPRGRNALAAHRLRRHLRAPRRLAPLRMAASRLSSACASNTPSTVRRRLDRSGAWTARAAMAVRPNLSLSRPLPSYEARRGVAHMAPSPQRP